MPKKKKEAKKKEPDPELAAALAGLQDDPNMPTSSDGKAAAAFALGSLVSGSDVFRQDAIAAGCLVPLVTMLEKGTEREKEAAAFALRGLSTNTCVYTLRGMPFAGLVAAFNPSVTPLSHHPEMRRGSGAVATIALGKPDEPLVSVPPPALIAANPPDPALGEARLSSFLGMPTLYPSIALAAAFVSIAVHLLSQVAGFNGLKLIVAGAIAGVISRTACAPIEMVATLMMCSGGDSKGMLPELKDAWRKDGMRGLFKGNGANCLKVAPQRGTQFLVYESAKRMLAENGWFGIVAGAPLPAGARLLAGGIAGMCAAVIVYPLEVIKTLRTVYPEQCTGIDETFRCVMKFGGIRSFYAGLTPTLFAMFPYVGFEFMVYETLKKHVMASTGLTQISVVAQLCIGALAGAAGQASAHPLDVVRRRMQMAFLQKKGMVKAKVGDEKKVPITNMIQGLYSIGKYEGLPMLFRGLGPACLEKVPSTAIGYVIYEAMKATLGVA